MINKILMTLLTAAVFSLPLVCAETSFGQNRKSVGAAEVTGTFRDYFDSKSKKSFNEIKIKSIGKGKLRVGFNLIYPTQGGGNMGFADGEAEITGDTAIFTPPGFEQCRITLKFAKPGQIKVSQNGNDAECGFGFNVSSTGTYKKISGASPKFKVVQ